MKITRIREATAPIASEIRNAFISFSTMTISLVAVETDVVRDGKPVIGYGFSSNGRYSQGGILRERFIPRILAAEPKSLVDEANDNLDPLRGLEGLHGQREARRPRRPRARRRCARHGRVGCGRQDRGQAAVAAAVGALQRRPPRRHGAGLSGRRLLLPRQGAGGPAGRDARLPGAGLQGGQDEDRRRRSRHRSASASRP